MVSLSLVVNANRLVAMETELSVVTEMCRVEFYNERKDTCYGT